MSLLNFAIGSPEVHVAPGNDFVLGGLHVTNSILYGWIICLIMIVALLAVARKVTVRPKAGFTQYVEAGVEFVRNLVEGAFDDKKIGRKYVPFFVTLFFFILFNNWSGLVPGVGDALQINGHPLLRPMTADLDATLSIGLITMIYVYISSVREVGGFGKYIKHFFMGSPLNPLYLVIGLIEMLTDLTRTLSLALRLFLNVTIGEIVIAVFAFLGGALLPGSVLSPITAVPFTLLELGVGALQAYIFVILGVNYLAISVNAAKAHEHDDLTEDDVPETIKATKLDKASGSAS
ncbi:MAG TPA: F0F1 ATP synthase subunit A [Candidatus Saccharimonadales bacterium]|nr:F0F1 ATP synthase subunit A [Candidatus Saccharimonadales bacterium]